MERTDIQLVEACLAGDRESFSTLVERHQDAVFNLAHRMTGHAADADDLAQEAFIRAYRKLHQYQSAYPFRNWVLGICANLTRNSFRQRGRRQAAEMSHLQLVDLQSPGRNAGPRQIALEQALMGLPEATRVPLVLKYMEGLSLEDIAQTLSLGLSAVKMRLARGRDALLAQLAGGGEIP